MNQFVSCIGWLVCIILLSIIMIQKTMDLRKQMTEIYANYSFIVVRHDL